MYPLASTAAAEPGSPDGRRGGNLAVDSGTFREALSQLAAAVNVVTTIGPAGRCGMTATAVCPVSDAPPTVLVCLNRAGRMNRIVKANGAFCVNMLGVDQRRIAEMFSGAGGMEADQRFAHFRSVPVMAGALVLDGGLAALECRIAEIREVATHSVMFGTVRTIHMGRTVAPLLHFRREYHAVADLTSDEERV